MKGGGLKDSREGALCDSGSLAGDLAEECFGKRAFGTRICCSLWQRHSYLHPSAMDDDSCDVGMSYGGKDYYLVRHRRLTSCCKVPPFVFYGKGKNQLPLTHPLFVARAS